MLDPLVLGQRGRAPVATRMVFGLNLASTRQPHRSRAGDRGALGNDRRHRDWSACPGSALSRVTSAWTLSRSTGQSNGFAARPSRTSPHRSIPRRNARRRRAVSWVRSRDHAGPADLMLLGHGDFRAMRRRYSGPAHPARSRADHEQVEIGHQTPALSIKPRVDGSRLRLIRTIAQISRDFLAQFDPELVERINAQQHRIGEGPVLVESDQRPQRAGVEPFDQDRRARPGRRNSSFAGRR